MLQHWPNKAQSTAVKNLVHEMIGPVDLLVDPTPLSGALVVAVVQTIAVQEKSRLSEEAMTACLLGEIDATIPWFAESFSTLATPGFEWADYSKNATGIESETFTGSDFALLIQFENDKARAAVFQAKKAKSADRLRVLQVSPARGGRDPEPQLLRFLAYAKALSSNDSPITDFHWAHYCGYSASSIFCRPLSDLEGLITECEGLLKSIASQLIDYKKTLVPGAGFSRSLLARARTLWSAHPKRYVCRQSPVIELAHLLELGAASPWGGEIGGWLNLESASSIEGFKKTASQMMPVAVASAGHGPKPQSKVSAGVARAREVVKHLNDQAKLGPETRPQPVSEGPKRGIVP